MPEGTEGQSAPQGGEQNGQQQNNEGSQQEQQAPPWERDGQEFNPERAWNLIQSLRQERDGIRQEHQTAAQELEQLRQASLTDQERALEEARNEVRTETTRQFGARLARTEFDALAARRNPDYDAAPALEFVDLTRFVGEDGEPDRQAIQAAVERLIPAPAGGTPSFDGGTRTPAQAPQDMNTFLRKATGRA